LKSVIVFGSLNLDLVTLTPRLPIAGETLSGTHFFTAEGGKGGNQAVAAARLGIPTYMVGRVGNDDFGRQLLATLKSAGVDTEAVWVDDTIHSGVASIVVNETGENSIVVIPGANGNVGKADLDRLVPLLSRARVLLLQLEIPISAVLAAAEAARNAGVTVILDPAPAPRDLPPSLYSLADIITPNEVEAAQLTGIDVVSPEAAAEAARELQRRGVKTAIVKLGDRGVCWATDTETFFIPAFSVDAVDTVAAGDAFNGALAAAIVRGLSLKEAIVWGSAAGAIAATQAGAQPSLPDLDTLIDFIPKL
jgi:ribokinase